MGDFVTGKFFPGGFYHEGFCCWGLLSWGILSLGDFVMEAFVMGAFVMRDFDPVPLRGLIFKNCAITDFTDKCKVKKGSVHTDEHSDIVTT